MRSFLAMDPLPCHILILRQNGNQQQGVKKKKNRKEKKRKAENKDPNPCASPPKQAVLPPVLQAVYLLLFCQEKLTRSQNEYENICIGVPREAERFCCCSQSFWKFICSTDDDNLDVKWNMKRLCARQSFPGSCRRPLMVLNTSGKLRSTQADDL